jgi:hypothetical protein
MKCTACGEVTLTVQATWRWCFYINIPLSECVREQLSLTPASCCMLIVILLLPLRRVRGSVSDKMKQLILLPLSWAGSAYPWSSAGVLAPLLIGLGILGLWVYIEARLVRIPIVPLSLLQDGNLAAAMVTMWFSGAAFYGTLYYLPSFYQVVQGVSAIRSGASHLVCSSPRQATTSGTWR